MTSWRMKRKFGKLWYWLKQKQDIRLAMVGIKPEFDTLMIATEVLQRVDQYTLNSLVTDINKGLPVDIVKSLLRYPISWHMASQHEKFIYLSLTQWLCKKYVEREIKDLDIDTERDNQVIDLEDKYIEETLLKLYNELVGILHDLKIKHWKTVLCLMVKVQAKVSSKSSKRSSRSTLQHWILIVLEIIVCCLVFHHR